MSQPTRSLSFSADAALEKQDDRSSSEPKATEERTSRASNERQYSFPVADADRGFPGQRYDADHDVNEVRLAALSWVSTIGIAIAAGSAFNVISASSFFGDDSPEAIQRLKHTGIILIWATGLYTISTIIIVVLQLMYGSAGFGTTMTIGKNRFPDLRHTYPNHYWIRRGIVFYTETMVAISAGTQLAGTLMVAEAATVFTVWPVRLFQGLIALIVCQQGIIWGIQSAIDQQQVRDFWRVIFKIFLPCLLRRLDARDTSDEVTV